MENLNQENKADKNPQPTDQVQLEIETVTPETEKDVVPTEQQEKSANEKEIGNESDKASGESTPPDKAEEDENESVTDKEDQSPAEEGNKEEGSGKSDRVADQIETVTPDSDNK